VEIAVAIAARAALRTAPLAGRTAPLAGRLSRHQLDGFSSLTKSTEFLLLTSSVFRCSALARVAGKYPIRGNDLRAAAAGAARAGDATDARSADAAADTAAAAARAADSPFAAREAARATDAIWAEIGSDVAARHDSLGAPLSDLPLWSHGAPEWIGAAWATLQAALPGDEDWDVWTRWCQERLQGGSRGEAYELVYASVPEKIWDEGPAAANAWIKAHLPKEPEVPPELPPPLPDLDSPFSYAWTAALRVAAVAGPQNLPFYPHFDSEEHHRQALEACRKGAERLLKSLRDGSHYNVRREYAEARCDTI